MFMVIVVARQYCDLYGTGTVKKYHGATILLWYCPTLLELLRLAIDYCHAVSLFSTNHCCREGSIPDIIACGSLHEFLCKAHKQYGPIVSLWFGPKLVVSLGSAKLFAEQAHLFDRGCKLHQKTCFFIVWFVQFTFSLLLTREQINMCMISEQ